MAKTKKVGMQTFKGPLISNIQKASAALGRKSVKKVPKPKLDHETLRRERRRVQFTGNGTSSP